MTTVEISAEVINCPGRWEDDVYQAIDITVPGVRSPFHMVMALSKVSVKALAEQVDPEALYQALAQAINTARPTISVALPH
jgi:hypothetical protein